MNQSSTENDTEVIDKDRQKQRQGQAPIGKWRGDESGFCRGIVFRTVNVEYVDIYMNACTTAGTRLCPQTRKHNSAHKVSLDGFVYPKKHLVFQTQ
ncbi:MAG TPA: hypothetical protein DCE42_10200 [Myxococcales bacterium]|nr:hypothetical protein [Deltaproteobacteria bacterium]MBU48108.1 hypothetical protein [Deltaproteobacteria bacterium]HAA55121.1 hypothetical protein [Myxococcales bacterium]